MTAAGAGRREKEGRGGAPRPSGRLAGGVVLALHPPVAECSQAGQHFAVFHPACLFLAPNDVVDVANGKALNEHSALESILKAFNPVGSEHRVKVKRTFSKLDKILPSKNLVLLPVVQGEPQLPQGRKKC